MYTYRCHNTKHVHLPLSQYKTCTPTAVTIQNLYTCCHNTKLVHLLLSQYKTCTPTAVTIQKLYTYCCHNIKLVHLLLSQYETCTPTAVTIQNLYTYCCHNYVQCNYVALKNKCKPSNMMLLPAFNVRRTT
jgi:hypothetical protein